MPWTVELRALLGTSSLISSGIYLFQYDVYQVTKGEKKSSLVEKLTE
jgi:hypothetical protein